MRHTRSLAILLTIGLVSAALVPAAATAAGTTLAVSADQDPATGEVTLTVTNESTAVENATVTVTAGSSYEGNGTYATGADGTVGLPEPSETVSVNVTAAYDGQELTEQFVFRPRADAFDADLEQADDGTAAVAVTLYGEAIENATVNVTSDGRYAANGSYRTDANGTVTLAQPEDTQNVTAAATYDGFESVTTTELAGDVDPVVELAQDGENVTATVTRDGSAVANATVNVTANATYEGNGTYATGADGTVDLPAPEDDVTVTITATVDDDEIVESFALNGVEPDLGVAIEQSGDGVTVEVTRGDAAAENATVEVDTDGNFSGEGTYEAGDDGTLALPLPSENVTVTVTATQGDDTATATERLTTEFVREQRNFGQAVWRFVAALQGGVIDKDTPPGRIISHFVVEHNPGNADDAPGREKKAGSEAKNDAPGREKGNERAPGQAKKSGDEDAKRGPPDHAKQGKDENGTETAEGESEDETEDESDDGDESEENADGNGSDDGSGDGDDGGDDNDDGGGGDGNGNGDNNGNGGNNGRGK